HPPAVPAREGTEPGFPDAPAVEAALPASDQDDRLLPCGATQESRFSHDLRPKHPTGGRRGPDAYPRADGALAAPGHSIFFVLEPLRRACTVSAVAAFDLPVVPIRRGMRREPHGPVRAPVPRGACLSPGRLPALESESSHAPRPLPSGDRADGRQARAFLR